MRVRVRVRFRVRVQVKTKARVRGSFRNRTMERFELRNGFELGHLGQCQCQGQSQC